MTGSEGNGQEVLEEPNEDEDADAAPHGSAGSDGIERTNGMKRVHRENASGNHGVNVFVDGVDVMCGWHGWIDFDGWMDVIAWMDE